LILFSVARIVLNGDHNQPPASQSALIEGVCKLKSLVILMIEEEQPSSGGTAQVVGRGLQS
jgi:hypothetical protein